MTIGKIKSSVESILLESYKDKTFSDKLKFFKKLVLENKNISKIFLLYDELSTKKGMSNDMVDDYINECVRIYENTINKINPNDLNKLKKWVKGYESDNKYENIDNLFSTDVLTLESKISGRKLIRETLRSKPVTDKEVIHIPLSSSLNIANKTLSQFIETLTESDKREFRKIIDTPKTELQSQFNTLKEETISKLLILKENENDEETIEKISSTINKVENENFDLLSYYRMKNLSENL